MHPKRFDSLTLRLGARISRRSLLGAAAGIALGATALPNPHFARAQADGTTAVDRYIAVRTYLYDSTREKAEAELPDLMLIDGGKGQLNAALEAISASGEQVAAIGLAKRNEEIFLPAHPDPVILPRNSKALHLLQRIRDEAHRFAVTYHRNLRGKTVRASILNSVPGIGPKRRRALVKHFGSVERIRTATVDELAGAPSMGRAAAEAVYGFFHPANTEE